MSGRAPGDHGTAVQAIDFALDFTVCSEPDVFLRGWREGDLDEWPEFYEWLAVHGPPEMTATPFWLPLQERRERQRAKVGAIAFVEHFHRCPECMATQAREYASASAPFDTARDRHLLRRDVNEALEIMVLEEL